MLLKLVPTEEQRRALLETMHAFNQAANYVAAIAFREKSANKFDLQKIVYGELRITYHLPAQLAIRCISKASEAYKRDKRIQPHFRPEGAVVYDPRVMNFKSIDTVSLLTLAGRVLVPFLFGTYQEARMDAMQGQADLLYRKGVFYLAVTLEMPEPAPATPDGTLGVDLGIINLATDSEGESFSGEAVEQNRKRHHALRQRLQKRGTKNAKRHLRKLSGQEARFKKHTNLAGVPLHTVDPGNTSRTCSGCGHCAKENRKSQASFCCINCGQVMNADHNAAINISRASVMVPLASGRAQVQAPCFSPDSYPQFTR